MDENNFEEMSGIREVESMGGGDLNMTPEQPVTPSYEIPRIAPEEPNDDSGSNKGPVILLIASKPERSSGQLQRAGNRCSECTRYRPACSSARL